MGFGAGNSDNNSNSNIFTNLVEVLSVEDTSEGSKADVALKVTIQQKDYEYSNVMYVSGWHVFEEDTLGDPPKMKKWGSSFKVQEFFNSCGLENEGDYVDDYGKIIPGILNKAVGCNIWTVRYPSTKTNSRITWDRSTSVKVGKTGLLNLWEKDRSKGYPRDYDENYTYTPKESSGDDFPFGANLPPEDNSAGISEL